MRGAFEEHGGEEVDSQGDAFFFAFRRARDAVRGRSRCRSGSARRRWPKDATVRVRVGIHTGEPGLAETGYHGLDVVRAARISGSAHGGQILVSSATRDLVGAALEDVTFEDLGEHRLKDLEQPQRIFQVVAPGLLADFPPLETADVARVMTIGGREQELAAAAEAALETEERRVRLFRRSRARCGGWERCSWPVAIAGVVVAITSGSGESAIAVVPDSVAVLDKRTASSGTCRSAGDRFRSRSTTTPSGSRTPTTARCSRIDPDSHEVVKTIGLGADVNSVAVGFGSVWVAGGNDETAVPHRPRRERCGGDASLRKG